ncbi:MAG: ComEC/Rec2 family competence protein [Bilophila sp.]
MQNPSLQFFPLQPLLFWQTGSLALVAGIVGANAPVMALTALALLCLADSRSWKFARLVLLGLCFGAGWWMGAPPAQQAMVVPPWFTESLETHKAVRVTGEVVRVEGLPNRRLRLRLHAVRPVAEDNSALLPGDVNWTWEMPAGALRPIVGQRVSALLKIRPIRGFRNAETNSFEDYWARKGLFFQSWSKEDTAELLVSGEPSWPAALREKLRQAVTDALGLEGRVSAQHSVGAGGGVIPALLFGDRFYLVTADVDRIKAAGLAHSLALSGQHLTVVGLGALALVAGIGLLVPGVFLHVPASGLLALLSVPLAIGYLWLGNAPPSLVRAVIMLVVWCLFCGVSGGLFSRLFCALRGRAVSSSNRLSTLAFPDALLVALTCMVFFDPLCVYDIGVQLSFTAVAGLALASPLLRRLWHDGPLSFSPLSRMRNEITLKQEAGSRCVRFLWLTLGCSLAAQLATLPLTMALFGSTTLWFPTNLLWLPVLGFMVLPLAFLGLIGVAVGWSALGGALLTLAAVPCDWLLHGLCWLQREAGMSAVWGLRPHWTGILGFGAVLVAAAMLVGRVNEGKLCVPRAAKRLFAGGILLLLTGSLLRFSGETTQRVTLRMLDVGQGQALLLEWPRVFASGYVLERQAASTPPLCPADTLMDSPQGWSRQAGETRTARALIDGGGFFSKNFDSGRDIVSPILTANREPRLDWIALSHPDQDHVRGLLFIGEQFEIEGAFTALLPGIDAPPDPPKPLAQALVSVLAQQTIPRHTLHAGDRLILWRDDTASEVRELVLQVLAPVPGEVPRANNGLIFRLVYKGRGLALFPGDAEAPYIRALLRRGVELQSEVLIVPHHGSAGSMVPALYKAVQPRLALASAGTFNSYRLPSWRVRETLEKQAVPLRSTAEEGGIVCTWELD